MGSSKWLTIKQASKIVGVCERSIYRYATRGIFQTKTELIGKVKTTLILEDDVLNWKRGRRDLLSSPLQRDVIQKLLGEVQTLKTQVATCMRILNIRFDPLNFTVPEYEHLYRAAEQLSTQGWSPHEEEMWSEYFVRFRVEDFEKVELATQDKHPWRPFLRLASSMHVSPYNSDLTEVLGAGRTNLQQVAGVWCVLKEESPRTFDILKDRDAVPLKKLMRRMNRVTS